jgi:thiamine biosynthesis protein ThiS
MTRKKTLWLLLNGERREVADGVSLAQLIDTLGLAPERIAIELNQNVVRRAEWPATHLKESDRIEIVHFVGGGAITLPISNCRFSSEP